jgi:hypothetical protein
MMVSAVCWRCHTERDDRCPLVPMTGFRDHWPVLALEVFPAWILPRDPVSKCRRDGPACPADQFVVCAATLSLLGAAAAEQAQLALIDDAHWLDEASVKAVQFAARRLGGEGKSASDHHTHPGSRHVAREYTSQHWLAPIG